MFSETSLNDQCSENKDFQIWMIGKLWQLQKLIDYSVCNKFASFIIFLSFLFFSCVGLCFFGFLYVTISPKIMEMLFGRFLRLIKNCFFLINPIQDGPFRGYSRMGGGQKGRLSKICHTYLTTMMKLGTVPYLKKIQQTYKSRDIPLQVCWHEYFFTGNQQLFWYIKKYRYRLRFNT